jgi:galactonate dehydratase
MPTLAHARIYRVISAKLHPIVLELETDDGLVGLGEAAVSFGLGGPATAEMIREICDRYLIGRDPSDIEAIWAELYDQSFWARGGGPITFGAISAIDIALWDLKGKRLGIPVYEFFGGCVRREVDVYANGWNYEFLDALSWSKAAERPLRDGYTAIKCYPLAIPANGKSTLEHPSLKSVGEDLFKLGVERMRSLRDVVGPDVLIRVDLCGAISLIDAIRFARAIEPLDIDWLEEAGDPADITSFAELKKRTSIPLAAGERFFSLAGFRDIIGSRALAIVQPDVGTCGGLMECLRIAAMGEVYGMKFAPHNCGGGILNAATLHVSACARNFLTLEVFPYFRTLADNVEVTLSNPEYRISGGKLAVSAAPGLGVEIDRAAVAPFLWSECHAG